jgi:Sulfatase
MSMTPTVDPRWGKVGKQKIVDEGPLSPGPNTGRTNYGGDEESQKTTKYNMTTIDEVLVEDSIAFMKKAKADGKPLGEADNTIFVFTTDNGAETFTWPDGGMTPFRYAKGTIYEGGFRVPCIARWPGHIKPRTVENGIFSGMDWYPTFLAAAGNPDIKEQLLKGVKLGDRTYKNHLDRYNQMALLEGTGPSARHKIFYFGGPDLGAVRVDNFKYQFFEQPAGWPGAKVATDMPKQLERALKAGRAPIPRFIFEVAPGNALAVCYFPPHHFVLFRHPEVPCEANLSSLKEIEKPAGIKNPSQA